MVGTPLTHGRFLRRNRGTYGAKGFVGAGAPPLSLPGAATPLPGLLVCGDSHFPGPGLPAVAASGLAAASCLTDPWTHNAWLAEVCP